jgi:16S rRNA processing protein RimM
VPETRILLGVIGRPHGVRGLVHVTSHTADPAALAEYGPLSDDRGRTFTLAWKGEGVAELTELRDGTGQRVADRDAAGRLTNVRLYIDRDRLPPPEDNEFYLADLIGLVGVDPQGREVGTVTAVHDHGAGAFLEIGPSLLIPFTRAAVPDVDLAGGRVVIVPPVESTLTPTLSRQAGEGATPASLARDGGEGAPTDSLARFAGEGVERSETGEGCGDTGEGSRTEHAA